MWEKEKDFRERGRKEGVVCMCSVVGVYNNCIVWRGKIQKFGGTYRY